MNKGFESAEGEIILPTVERERLTFEEDICNLKSMTHEQRRELMTLYRIRQAGGSDALKNVVNKDLGRIALGAKNFDDERIRRELGKDVVTYVVEPKLDGLSV